jgi:hypothetical protein
LSIPGDDYNWNGPEFGINPLDNFDSHLPLTVGKSILALEGGMENKIDLIRLRDGRMVRREPNGRFREIASGKWVSAGQVENQMSRLPEGKGEREEKSRQALVQEAVVGAARQKGMVVSSPDEAFAEIVGVQAGIALDKDKPNQATNAARFIVREAHLTDGEAEEEGKKKPWFILGRELAEKVLEMVEEEIERRIENE